MYRCAWTATGVASSCRWCPAADAVGEVVALGPGVTAFEIGERGAVRRAAPCGDCVRCNLGDPDTCTCKQMLGVHLDVRLSLLGGATVEPEHVRAAIDGALGGRYTAAIGAIVPLEGVERGGVIGKVVLDPDGIART